MTNRKQLLGRIARKHLAIPTLEIRRSDSLDFYQVSVWVVEAALNAAYQAGRRSAGTIDVDSVLAKRKQVAVIWCIKDIQEMRPDLSDDQAWDVLQQCRDAHDCNSGFTWSLIDLVAADLFPEPAVSNTQGEEQP